jgi:hypothetical protein
MSRQHTPPQLLRQCFFMKLIVQHRLLFRGGLLENFQTGRKTEK